jgi:hypothetical protein
VTCVIANREKHADGEEGVRPQKADLMSQHVHVRLSDGMAVSEDGELVEHTRCRCGATWTKTYAVGDDESQSEYE